MLSLNHLGIFLITLLISCIVFVAVPKTNTNSIMETIYIRADGTVDPINAPIQRFGDVYTLIDNISSNGDGIVIERDDIMLKGEGHKIEGAGSSNGLTIVGRRNVTVENTEVRDFAQGTYLRGCNYTSLVGNNITASSSWGINLEHCSFINITGNNVTANHEGGIRLYYSSCNNTIGKNKLVNVWNNILLTESSNNNTIAENEIASCEIIGLDIDSSEGNHIIGNDIVGNKAVGIYLRYGSQYNTFVENNITANTFGIAFIQSDYNRFYHNSFLNNTHQVTDFSWSDPHYFSSWNYWDNGYPLGGNYWSDFKTRYPSVSDNKNGQYQNVSGSDGIWDSPYVIDSYNKDSYPIVPESSSFLVLPLFMMATLLTVILYRKKSRQRTV